MSKTIIELIAQDNSAKAVAKVEKVLGKKLLRAIHEKASTVAKEAYGTLKEFFGDDQPQYVNPADSAYAVFFANALKKFGVNGPEDFTDENTKAQFFQYVDNNWKAQDSVQGIAAPTGPTLEVGTQTQLPATATPPQPPPTPEEPSPVGAPVSAPMPEEPMPADPAPVPPPAPAPAPVTMPQAGGFQIPPGYMLVLHPATGQMPYGGGGSNPSVADMAPSNPSNASIAPMGDEGSDPSLNAVQAAQSGQNPNMGAPDMGDDDQDPDLEIGDEDTPEDNGSGFLDDASDEEDGGDNNNEFDPNDDYHAVDVDGDGIPDHMDDDVDGDGVPNDQDGEHDPDVDDDGVPNEADDDNSTFDPGFGDEDGDGTPDNQDLDADGNGKFDDTEDMDGDGVPDRSDADADGDDIADPDDPDGGDGTIKDFGHADEDSDGEVDPEDEDEDDDPFGDDDDYNIGEDDFASDEDDSKEVPDVDGDGKPEKEMDVDGDGESDLVVGDDPEADDEEDPDLTIGDDDDEDIDDSDEDEDDDESDEDDEDADEDEDEEDEQKQVVEESVKKPRAKRANAFPRSEDFGYGVDNELDKLFIKEELEPQIQDAKEDGNKDLVKKLQAAKEHLKSIKTSRDKHLAGLRKHRAAIMADKTLTSAQKEERKKELASLAREHKAHCRKQARRIKKLHTGK